MNQTLSTMYYHSTHSKTFKFTKNTLLSYLACEDSCFRWLRLILISALCVGTEN